MGKEERSHRFNRRVIPKARQRLQGSAPHVSVVVVKSGDDTRGCPCITKDAQDLNGSLHHQGIVLCSKPLHQGVYCFVRLPLSESLNRRDAHLACLVTTALDHDGYGIAIATMAKCQQGLAPQVGVVVLCCLE